jgi:sporulation protein YlmC with PRC-barrel domain
MGEKSMPTTSGHTKAILASKVTGTSVYNTAGEKIGEVEDIILDKTSDRVLYAALGFGGLLGIGEKYAPVPWSVLDYQPDKGGYVVPLSVDTIKNAPTYRLEDLTKDDGQIRTASYKYYNVPLD